MASDRRDCFGGQGVFASDTMGPRSACGQEDVYLRADGQPVGGRILGKVFDACVREYGTNGDDDVYLAQSDQPCCALYVLLYDQERYL